MQASMRACLLLAIVASSSSSSAAAAAAAGASQVTGCCLPPLWQGRQVATYLSIARGVFEYSQVDILVTYDYAKQRSMLLVHNTANLNDRRMYLYYHQTGKRYSLDFVTNCCKVKSISTVFPKRCIPASAQVVNSNVMVNTTSGLVQTSRVYYERQSFGEKRSGLLLVKNNCVPIFENEVWASTLSSFKTIRATFHQLTEPPPVPPESIFDLPSYCQQVPSAGCYLRPYPREDILNDKWFEHLPV